MWLGVAQILLSMSWKVARQSVGSQGYSHRKPLNSLKGLMERQPLLALSGNE